MVINSKEKRFISVFFVMFMILTLFEKNHESTRIFHENDKTHLGFCTRVSDMFLSVCKILFAKRRCDRNFLTIDSYSKRKKNVLVD